LNREWRQNDLMWGRLDAAERIIRCVSQEANTLIHEANLAIAGSEERLTQLRKTYEVNRKLPLVTRLKLGFAAGRIILKMVAGYFISWRQ
jgi:hypothetical protein